MYTGTAAVLFLALLTTLFLVKPKAPSKRQVRKQVFMESGEKFKPSEKKVKKEVEKQPEVTVVKLNEDVLKIAPHVYYAVRLKLMDGSYLEEISSAHTDLKSIIVSLIEIFVRAKAWDKLKSAEKIDLLYRTFSMLKSQYPYIGQLVRLAFDDGRQNLKLKFDDFLHSSR